MPPFIRVSAWQAVLILTLFNAAGVGASTSVIVALLQLQSQRGGETCHSAKDGEANDRPEFEDALSSVAKHLASSYTLKLINVDGK